MSAQLPAAAYAQPEAPVEPARRTILVLDDDPIVRAVVAAVLEGEGHHVVEAGDLADFDRQLKATNPDLIVADLNLPDGAGDQVCRRLKRRMTRLVPVVLMSALPPTELAQRATAAGAEGIYPKELGTGHLKRVIHCLMDEIIF